MNKLEVVCPNIDDLPLDEVLTYANDSKDVCKKSSRVTIIKLIYKVLGYNLEPDLLLALVDETEKQLMLAPAGGAKTSTANVKIILEKLYRKSKLHPGKKISGDNILFLVYNNQNVNDVKNRHTELVTRIKTSGIQDIDYLDSSLNVSTIHSFCKMWIETYERECQMEGFKLMLDESKDILMKSAIKVQIKKFGYAFSESDISTSNLLSIYNLMRETMIDFDRIEEIDKFIDLGLEVDFVKAIFTTYDNVKRRQRRYDHTDSLTKFYELISQNETVLSNIKSNYEYMVCDESQDLTPIMIKIIKLLSKDINLVMIGDDDQAIYGFRGAATDNILKFTSYFPDGRVFLLKTNRRCPKNVVELGNSVLGMIGNRYNKDIRSIKSNGKIEFRGYAERKGQILSILKILEGMTDKEKSETCICYRNKSSCVMLVDTLVDRGMHFHILSGVQPYKYKLFLTVIEILRALNSGNNKKLLCNLYKCLPITKDKMADLLNYDLKEDKPTDGKGIMNLNDIDFGKMIYNQSSNNAINFLKSISKNIGTASLNSYIPNLILQIKKYYWDSTCKYLKYDLEEDVEFTKSILKYFDVNKTFMEKYNEYERDINVIKSDQLGMKGICISTFHSLKGLEKDTVIIMDLAESIFPNSSYIEMKPYSEENKQALKDSETRLLYVAITRTKQTLYLYYRKEDPSIYISVLLNSNMDTKMATSINTSELDKLTAIETLEVVDDDEDNGIVILDNDNNEKIKLEDVVIKPQALIHNSEFKNNTYKDSLINRFFK